MAQKYYNSSEAAKILGKTVEQVKQMLERRELHGYRDGADWKFKVEDIDRMAKSSPAPAADDDVGDVLLSEVELGHSDPGLSGTVIGLNAAARLAVDSDIRLAESDLALSALNEGSTATAKRKAASTAKGPKSESSDLMLSDELKLSESPIVLGGKAAAGSSSALDLGARESEDDLVLAGSGTGSDVTLGGDSGISLIDPSDSGFSLETPVNLSPAAEESLELGEDDVVGGAKAAAAMKTDDEFLLTPMEESIDTEGSESGSQVIALDSEDSGIAVGAGSEVSMAAMLDEDVAAQPVLDMGMGAPLVASPVLTAQPAVLAEGAAVMQGTVYAESPYTGWQITGLAVCTTILFLCGIMTYELLRSMWNFEQPNGVSSGLMNTVLSWIGL